MSRFIKDLLAGIFPRPPKVPRATRYKCKGGPLDGQVLPLRTGGTLEFSLYGVTGAYVPSGTESNVVNWKPKELV